MVKGQYHLPNQLSTMLAKAESLRGVARDLEYEADELCRLAARIADGQGLPPPVMHDTRGDPAYAPKEPTKGGERHG